MSLIINSVILGDTDWKLSRPPQSLLSIGDRVTITKDGRQGVINEVLDELREYEAGYRGTRYMVKFDSFSRDDAARGRLRIARFSRDFITPVAPEVFLSVGDRVEYMPLSDHPGVITQVHARDGMRPVYDVTFDTPYVGTRGTRAYVSMTGRGNVCRE